MKKKELLKFIGEILNDNFKPVELSFNDSIDTIPEWDSLAIVSIATALQAEFDIEIDVDELEMLTSIKGIYTLINEKNKS